jgi:fructosamine-3-kinase
VAARAVSGGDINDAYRVELSDGRIVFVKANARLTAQAFQAEARGLAWLAEAATLRIPAVCAMATLADAVPFLALEWLESRRPQRGFEEVLGRGLAGLHRFGAAGFGLSFDNAIGSLPQGNGALPQWVDFYRERRLLPQLSRAADQGALPVTTLRRAEALLLHLAELVGPDEPPARLQSAHWARGRAVFSGPGVLRRTSRSGPSHDALVWRLQCACF